MSKVAISLAISPPGAGKGTQAEKLAEHFELIQFDTGTYLEKLLHSEEAERDPILKKEQEIFDSGVLNTPDWVLQQVKKEAKNIAKEGKGVIYSGSPRTVYEAVGDGKGEEGLASALAKAYGKKNVYFVNIEIDEETTIERNTKRLVCSVDGDPIFSEEDEKNCRKKGGKPQKRKALDNPEVIKQRLKEYRERTFPIKEAVEKEGYNVITVDGSPLPDEVFKSILSKLKIEKS